MDKSTEATVRYCVLLVLLSAGGSISYAARFARILNGGLSWGFAGKEVYGQDRWNDRHERMVQRLMGMPIPASIYFDADLYAKILLEIQAYLVIMGAAFFNGVDPDVIKCITSDFVGSTDADSPRRLIWDLLSKIYIVQLRMAMHSDPMDIPIAVDIR